MNHSSINPHNPEDSKPPGHHANTVKSNTQSTASYPDELVVRLAHLASLLEAQGQIELHDWDTLCHAIQQILNAYDSDWSENFNPTCIEDAAEQWFIDQFGTEKYKESTEQKNPENSSPEHLIAASKQNFKPLNSIIASASTEQQLTSNVPPPQSYTR